MKRILFSIFAAGVCSAAFAIPARPGLIDYTQPDGSIIKIRMVGDEHGHIIYDAAGNLLIDSDGWLEYASFNAEGFPVASGLKASSIIDRGVLSGLQRKENLDKWIAKMTTNREDRLGMLIRASQDRALMKKTRAVNDASDGDDGDSDEIDDAKDSRDSDGARLVPEMFGRCETAFPVTGEKKGLVVLVEYKDIAFQYGDFDYFDRMLNEEGFSDNGSLGSARDWFVSNSGGRFLPQFDVYGPVVLPENRVYYGANDAFGNDMRAHEMAIHALQILDDEVDFSQYDTDGDGMIDNVFIFYAGKGEHDAGIKNAVWAHSWDVASGDPTPYIFDEVRLNHYACTCEYPSGYKRPDGIGTFVHEFSHVMGLPDLYSTVYNSSFTPGEWSVMDTGPYNNEGLTPPNYSSYEKCALGWMDFLPMKEGLIELPDFSESGIAYALPTGNPSEFYFFENRQQNGNDTFLPGHGMLVWHVDYKKNIWFDNTVNNNPYHQYVDLIEADNVKSDVTRAADAFPGKKSITEFGFDSKPQLASWAKERLDFDLAEISESEEGLISFVAVPNPDKPQDPDAVDSIEVPVSGEDIVFDLMGRRVMKPGKGLYIVNGKKVIF